MSSFFAKLIIGLLTVRDVLAIEIITPYGDSECRDYLSDATMDIQGAEIVPTGTSIWHFTEGYPASTNWDNLKFPSANSSYGGSGKEVWWKVPTMRSGCNVVLMQRFLENIHGIVDPNQPQGNVIISTQSEGCLYSSLSVSVISTIHLGSALTRSFKTEYHFLPLIVALLQIARV